MPTVRRVASGVALLLLSCGPEPAPPPAETEELCGGEGPHRLLALEPGDLVSHVTRVGDHLVYVAGPGHDEPILGPSTSAEPTVYSTDLCGEDRVVVATDMIPRAASRRWPEALFGCRRETSDDLYVLDPTGVAEPRVVLADGCRALEYNEHGLYEFEPTGEDSVRRLVFIPHADTATPVFGDPVVLLDSVDDRWGAVDFLADEVLALDPEGTLLRISLPDGATTVEQSDVQAFKGSSDGRYLVWQDAHTLDGDPDDPAGDIFLRDRETGVDTGVGHGALHGVGFGDDFVRLDRGSDVGERFVWLPSYATSDVPAGWRTVTEIADGRWLVSQSFWSAPFALRDLATGEQTPLTDMAGPASVGPEFLHILAGAESGSLVSTGELWRFRYDGSAPNLAARRASTGFRHIMPDGLVATVVDPFAAGFGRLIAVDPDTLAESVIDERVLAFPIGGPVLGVDTILYHVDDGERSGVWAVKLPAGD